ncbi:MAG: hypothetical protein HOV79_11300, partial [Hamadaea sp.]|nr:hypothetical protein [Hamadaea sp.]
GGRHAARLLAVAPPVTVLIVAATAYAPALVILPLSGEAGTARFVLACVIAVVATAGAPLAAVGGWVLLTRWDGGLERTPIPFEKKYAAGALGVGLAAAASITGAVTHVRIVGALLVVATFLAAVMLLLGEAQRWSETHGAPPGLLVLGFTRVPVSALTAGLLVLASFWLGDGAEHAVHRQRDLPAALSGQAGVSLSGAFAAWVAGNCAGPGVPGRQVPLFLVAAPGGGLRAAYWTSSTLTDLFGATRAAGSVEGCAAAAPSDRVFAMGGASGGSLGALAYAAGLDSGRGSDWYDEQVGRPDFLTDPLTWMLTVDLARGYVGYGGQDRARRLEDGFARSVTGLGDDFFAGQWGLGGRTPLMLLTGTQVESGCRLNISGLRLTDAAGRAAGGGCTAIGHGVARLDAPVTTDLLDVLCGRDGAAAASLSRSTAAVLSARFPYVSPSGQLYGCGSAHGAPTAIVDGGYAENTGLGMLLALWPRLSALIAAHNTTPGNAQIVPVLLEISNGYARVAAPRVSGRTVEGLVPTSTRARPDALDERALEQQAAAAFAGRVPGSALACDLALNEGRFVVISPRISPGLPAPLAWSLSTLATDDLSAQRERALVTLGPAVRAWATSNLSCLVSAPAAS